MKFILLLFIFTSLQAVSSLEQCGVDTESPEYKTLSTCEQKPNINSRKSCYKKIHSDLIKKMKKKSIFDASPTLRNLLTEVRKSFDLSNDPKRKISYYEALELFRTANECQQGAVKLFSYDQETDAHIIQSRSCEFSPEQKRKSLEAARETMTNHYVFLNAGKRLNDLNKLLSPPIKSNYRTEPEPLGMQDCREGMPAGAYPPQGYISKKREFQRDKDKMGCPQWIEDIKTCGETPNGSSTLSTSSMFQELFNLGVNLQIKAYSEHILTLNPNKLTPNYKEKVKEKIESSLDKCFKDRTIDRSILKELSGEQGLLGKPYFSKDGYEEYEKHEAIEVAKSIKKLAVLEKYYTKVAKKLALLNKYYQGRCGRSIWFPSWGKQSNPECDKVGAHIEKFNKSIVAPLQSAISAERNQFPFLSIPLSGGEFGSSTCFTGVIDDIAGNPLSYVMYGQLTPIVKSREFSLKSKKIHYDMSCGKPLWKGAVDSKKYKTKLDNYSLVHHTASEFNQLFKLTPAKSFQSRPTYPKTDVLHNLLDRELSETNIFSEINQFKGFIENLNNQPPPTKDEIDLTAKLKRTANAGLEDALVSSLKEACENPQDYGKELLSNDTIGKTFFAEKERDEQDAELYCSERTKFIEESKRRERNLSDASIAIGMLGFIHPAAAVTVLPIEFGLEYVQYKEAVSDKRRDLSLALFGLADYSKADEEISTLKSEELMFYGIIGAMALGGAGDIADVFGTATKYSRFSGKARNATQGISSKGLDDLKDFQRQIVALDNSGLNDIQKRLEILDRWRHLERTLSPEDFLKLQDQLGDQISSIKGLLARDIKFDLAREFAKSDLAFFIDDIQRIESTADLDTLITAYKMAKSSDKQFDEFLELLKRRGGSCGV